jgi:tetratricopeptide (TPR) repeat protein
MFCKLWYLLKYLIIIAVMAMMGLPGVAQSGSPSQSAPTKPVHDGVVSTPAVAQALSGLSLEERITRVEERLNLALALKDERIQSINERSENTFKLLQFFSALAALALLFFSIRDIALRWKEGQRQRGIDEIVRDTMNLQKSAAQQQIRFGQLRLDQVEASPNQQFDAVKNVNDVIGVVRQTLAFRLEQEEKVAEVLGKIQSMEDEQGRIKKQKLAQAITILEHLRMSRMEFATLTDEQHKRGIRLQGLVNDLDGFLTEQDFQVAGNLLYTCGVVAYYDNDIIEAKSYLDRAAERRATDHVGELKTNDDYRNRFAFIHHFRALIHKNWGDLSEAQHEIEQSAKLLENLPNEFLTPVTKAEIQSYIVGSEERCRAELQDLMQRISDLETGLKKDYKALNANQAKLRNRMFVLCGNTYFMQKAFQDALIQYTKAIEFNQNDYYALSSAARCKKALGDGLAAEEYFRHALEAIERSADLRKKRERITRAVIAVIAENAANGCGERVRQEQYGREARELLSGKLEVDGLSPKFFSPSTARLVSSAELLNELEL